MATSAKPESVFRSRPEDGGRGLSQRFRPAIPLGLFAAALAWRALPWHSVFRVDGVYPHGYDAYYHLRRIQYTVEHFPSHLSFDPFMNFPHGAQPIWPPTFDWLIAMVLRFVVGPGRPGAVESWVMWVPPFLGGVTVALVYFLGRRFFSQAVGVMAALLLAVLPAHFWYSQLGAADHHVAVSLLSILILWAGMSLFACPLAEEGRDAGGLAHAALLGLAMGAAVVLWPGSLIHVSIAQTALVFRSVTAKQRWEAVKWTRRFGLTHVAALAAVCPLSAGNEWLRWGSFSPVVLSNFQPIYFAATAAFFWICSCVWHRWNACVRRRRRLVVALLVGGGLAGLLFGSIPELRGGVVDSWSWLARREEFQAVVAESDPLFHIRPGGDWAEASRWLSAFIYVIPLALAMLAWKDWHRADRAFLLWWALGLFVATLSQRRFMNSYAVPHALVMAQAVSLAYNKSSSYFGRRKLRDRPEGFDWASPVCLGGWGLRFVGASLILAILAPVTSAYKYHVQDVLQAARGQTPRLAGASRSKWLVVQTARWLHNNSPEPRGTGYSVLGPWGDGHIIKYVAQRPVVQDNFGDDVSKENFALAEHYFSSREEYQGLRLLRKARVRYVLVRATGSGHSSGYKPDSLFSRLYRLKGTRGQVEDVASGRRSVIEALKNHRLVYESPSLGTGDSDDTSFCKLFEVVRGARVVGNAAPGSLVVAHLELTSRHGGGFVYKTATKADAQGRYALRLPYSNEVSSNAIAAADSYTLVVGGRPMPLFVSEEAVNKGLEIRVPR